MGRNEFVNWLEFNARAWALCGQARVILRDLLRARLPRRRWIIYGTRC
jgi:hypothetical protein